MAGTPEILIANEPSPPEEAAPAQPAAAQSGQAPADGFSARVEAAFEADMDAMQVRQLRRSGLVALLLYGLFAISDFMMMPDAYWQAWKIRMTVLPLLVLGILGGIRLPGKLMREIIVSVAIVLVGVSVAWIAGLSRHPNAVHYHAGIILVVLFGNIALGQRFRGALVTSVALSVVYGFYLIRLNPGAAPVRFNSWLLFFAAAVISLLANYQMNHDRRLAHLARARERERNEELSHAVELLQKLSAEDALTQIANRRELDYRLKLEWGRARRESQPLAMILIDVDCFKNYNDHYGHPAGDSCLQQIAIALSAVPQRSSDLVARFGGEEFVVLLPATALEDAAEVAERMRQAVLELNMPHAASTVAPVVSASFGVAAALPALQTEPAQLLADADAALYRAKLNGRNQVAVQVPREHQARRA
ncbi:GGDEF domain-containing protein [Noviherbaspirillum massiliense]|uniref:GGDEF domain-containing protein n=1 Tax=Noviherbaspirillum massiliense TaxID=1465823 RepID=UPI0003066732|nr:diguanylate cyclase [Noviherbaspirillum massiliense]